jgi:hypothetical protein
MDFTYPYATLFFNHDPNRLILACENGIFIVDVNTRSTQPFSSTPKSAWYCPHALALSDDDSVLVAGNSHCPYSVCGYDTVSRTRLWIHRTVSHVDAVCMLGAHFGVTVRCNPTLVLDLITGKLVATLHMNDGFIFGLGLMEGLRLIFSSTLIIRAPQLRVPRHVAASPV